MKDKTFFQETDTFNLSVTLQNKTLFVTLKDFTAWEIYSNEYTEGKPDQDLKMDLEDVYSAFSQAKAPGVKVEEGELMKYEFGSVVANGGLPCYKVEREGKITAYLNLIDRRTGKELLYQSSLKLKKVRNMTEVEIVTEKKGILEELSRKIDLERK